MGRHRILIIGQAHSPRLAMLCGIEMNTLYSKYDVRTLLPAQQNLSAGRFPMARARRMARHINLEGRTVVLVGHVVARAFGLKGLEPFTWTLLRGGTVAFIPQPSLSNLWYSDPENWMRAKEFMQQL